MLFVIFLVIIWIPSWFLFCFSHKWSFNHFYRKYGWGFHLGGFIAGSASKRRKVENINLIKYFSWPLFSVCWLGGRCVFFLERRGFWLGKILDILMMDVMGIYFIMIMNLVLIGQGLDVIFLSWKIMKHIYEMPWIALLN